MIKEILAKFKKPKQPEEKPTQETNKVESSEGCGTSTNDVKKSNSKGHTHGCC